MLQHFHAWEWFVDVIQLGGALISMQVALPILGLFVANGVALWFQRRQGLDAGPLLLKMTLAGFIGARLIFVLRHRELYAGTPLGFLDFRDQGFDGTAGLIVACVVGAELTRRRPSLRRPLLGATLAGCAVWLGGMQLNQAMTPPGAPLPALDVRGLDGATVPLHAFAGRPLVVNLWATWCPPCRRELPALAAAQRAHPEANFVFVNQGESPETVRRFLAEQGVQVANVLVDPASQLSARTASAGFPTTLFYDAAGRQHVRHTGELSQATLGEKLGLLRAPD
jgi:thiol-disulfide isomerase/thioredoxin